jgi:hypothetical protein
MLQTFITGSLDRPVLDVVCSYRVRHISIENQTPNDKLVDLARRYARLLLEELGG